VIGFRVKVRNLRIVRLRVKGQGSRVKGQGSRVKGQGSRVKGQGSRVKVQESRAECVRLAVPTRADNVPKHGASPSTLNP
jgi:hypothetical protein